MSKLSASEFQTWESLYWPDRVPRTSQLSESPLSTTITGLDKRWSCRSGAYSVSRDQFGELVDDIASQTDKGEKTQTLAVLGSDPLFVLAAAATCFKTGLSVEIVFDPSKTNPACPVTISQTGRSGEPRKDLSVAKVEVGGSKWEPAEPSVSILFPEDVRAAYPLRDLRGGLESFVSFLDLSGERGLAVLGSLRREFGFIAAMSGLVAGVPLVLLGDIKELQAPPPRPSVLFLGRDKDGTQEGTQGSYRSALGELRREFAFVGVEGPASGSFTRGLERSTGIPVLQMYGISGRGIILSNPREFNTHGSAGIPITNAEAIIADNYEGNWTRDRILMGPGVEGELVVRGSFVDGTKDVGDSRQNPVRAAILGQSTEWVTTGIMGKMDENGYFYFKDPSFR